MLPTAGRGAFYSRQAAPATGRGAAADLVPTRERGSHREKTSGFARTSSIPKSRMWHELGYWIAGLIVKEYCLSA